VVCDRQYVNQFCNYNTSLLPGSRRVTESKESMKTRTSSQAGFTLVEIMIVVALIGLLAAIATPTWVRARTSSQTNTCVNNLRQIDAAKQQWAVETKQATNATPTYSDISSYLKHSVACPTAGADSTFAGSYEPMDVATPPMCKIAPGSHLLAVQPGS
jgi:prepilin-type N-terminal cleavage/methylation domain-containing protein